MPNKLKAHSNERIDLVDFVHSANTYTAEIIAFANDQTILDRRSRLLEGFYVEISDQTSTPGQITIFNGAALDRSGAFVHDESLVNSSSTVTLAGASQNFYVEIEFYETESAQDSRAFWDPTVPNVTPIPDGTEVEINVATRITPNWRIVYPVSTSGFASTVNPNSNRIPIALLNTNGANQITNAVNSYGSLVNASTKAEQDVVALANSVRVIDSKLFAIGSQFTYDFGGTNPETVRTVTNNDLDNNIITFIPVLTFSHQAGAIIRQTGVTARYLPQTLDPNDPTFSAALLSAQPNDQAKRLWQGDEIRGSAYLASKSTFGSRNDIDIRTLKDEVDFLSALLRDLKWGHPRTDVTSNAPPASFSTRPRYFDSAGGVAGARTAYVTIGNGSTSFGDFNGTDQTPFIAASNALPAGGGTIYVKPGTYTFTAAWTPNKTKINVIGDSKVTTIIVNDNVSACISIASISFGLKDITVNVGTGSSNTIDLTANAILRAEECELTGITVDSSSILASYTDFNGTITNSIALGGFNDSVFDHCNFTTSSGVTSALTRVLFNNCTFTTTNTAITANGNVSTNVAIVDCRISTSVNTPAVLCTGSPANWRVYRTAITGANAGATTAVFSATSTTTDLVFTGCYFTGNLSGTSAVTIGSVVSFTGVTNDVAFNDCVFACTGAFVSGLSKASYGSLVVDNCDFGGITYIGIDLTSTQAQGRNIVSNCIFNPANTSNNYFGISLTNCEVPTSIINNTFVVNSSGGAPTKYGVYITQTVADPCSTQVKNNTFKVYSAGVCAPVYINNDISVGSNSEVTGNVFQGAAISGTYTGIRSIGMPSVITNNTFTNFSGAGSITCVALVAVTGLATRFVVESNTFNNSTGADIRFVNYDVLGGSNSDFAHVHSNVISDIISTGAGAMFQMVADAAIIESTMLALINNNEVRYVQVGSSGTSSVVRGINCPMKVSSNSFEFISTAGGELCLVDVTGSYFFEYSSNHTNSVTSTASVRLVKLTAVNGIPVISDNVFDFITGATTFDGVWVSADTLGLVCTGNTVNGAQGFISIAGIYVTGTLYDGLISNNNFRSFSAVTNWWIYATACANSSIINNLFYSDTTNTSSAAVRLLSVSQVIINDNNIVTRNGLGVVIDSPGINRVSISNNTINTYGTASTAAVAIAVSANTASSSNLSICDNTITSSSTAAAAKLIQVEVVHTGVSGQLANILVKGNNINLPDSTSAFGIYVSGVGVGAGYRMGGITVSNNTISESGTAVNAANRILVSGVAGFNALNVTVANNSILQNATAGVRLGLFFSRIENLNVSGNTMHITPGAGAAVSVSDSFRISACHNVMYTDCTAEVFRGNGGTGTSDRFTAVGNTIQVNGGNLGGASFTNPVAPAGSNNVW